MTHTNSRLCTLAALIATLGSASCGDTDPATIAEARAKAQAGWKLTLEGAEALVLERMDIYLEEDDSWEPFILYGGDVALVGIVPMDMQVGYEAELSRLVGKTLDLKAEGGDPGAPVSSYVTMDGTRLSVVHGSLHVEKLTGKWDGSEGDKTLSGSVELVVEGDDGQRTLRGTFAVLAITLG